MERRRAVELGRLAEDAVEARLRRDGWSVIARNWRSKVGEIDCIVARGGVLRFVEVKLRGPDDLAGLEGIDLRRVRQAAELWLSGHHDLVDEAALMLAWVSLDDDGFHIELMDDPD